MNRYFVYILASKPYGTLYIGVTNSLLDRVEAHRNGTGSRFTARYGVSRLVYYEEFGDVNVAIQREKSLKRYLRTWKINLIERDNPHWCDLYPQLRALPGNASDRARDVNRNTKKNASDGVRGEMGPRDKPEDNN